MFLIFKLSCYVIFLSKAKCKKVPNPNHNSLVIFDKVRDRESIALPSVLYIGAFNQCASSVLEMLQVRRCDNEAETKQQSHSSLVDNRLPKTYPKRHLHVFTSPISQLSVICSTVEKIFPVYCKQSTCHCRRSTVEKYLFKRHVPI